MTIAIISKIMNVMGGGTRQIVELAKELKKRGHEVKIYTFAYDRENCFPGDLDDIPVIVSDWHPPRLLKIFYRAPFFGGIWYRFLENQKCRHLALLVDPRTDVLNPHDQTSVHVAHYVKKCIKKIPSVWMVNDLHIARWSISDHPLLGAHPRSRFKQAFFAFRDWYERKRFLDDTDAHAVIVERMAGMVKKFFGKEAAVVRSGLDLERFAYIPRNGIQGKRIRLYAQGLFAPYRRFEDAIEAVRILCDKGYDPALSIVGDYESKDIGRGYYEKLAALCRKRNISGRVKFRGVITDKEMEGVYRDTDIFLFPSIQTWGIAIFEAMASGVPVVLSRDAGAQEILEDGKTMRFARTGDPDDIARVVAELAENPEMYIELSRRGSEFVRNNISWKKYADSMEALFEKALRRERHF